LTQFTDTTGLPHRKGLTTSERRVLLLTSPCHFLTHMFILVFPAVTMPIIVTTGMPLEDVVRLSFLMYFAYGVGALPAGYLADRWEARRLLIGGVYAMGLGLALVGLFPVPRLIPLWLMIVGLGASIYHPAGLALISHTVEKRGYALGLNGVFGNLGIAFAPLITGVLTWLFSWQTACVALGLSSVLTGFLLSLIPIDETIHPVHAKRAEGGSDYVKYFVILGFALVFGGIAYRGNTVLLPSYLELKTTFFANLIDALPFERSGNATLGATVLTSVVFFFGIFGQLLGGKLADRYDLRYAYLGVQAAAVPFLIGMAFTTDYLLAFCAAVYALFSLGMQPIENSLIAALTPARWRSTGFAIKFILTFGVGSGAVYLVGIVKEAYSLETVYVCLGGVAMGLVLSIIVLIAASRRVRHIRN
jgi:MFS family permease